MKTRVKVSISKIWSLLLLLFRYGFKLYALVAIVVGTVVMAWPFVLVLHNATAPAPMPVWLPNDFSYSHDWDTPASNNHITYRDGTEVIKSDVRKVMWYDDWVYGYRIGHAKEVYYFICQHGQDCSNSQSYKDIEFNSLLKKHGLPEFTNWDSKGYDTLLKEQVAKGIDTGHGG